jgi:transposase
MHIKTLLNYVTNYKGFVFQTAQLDRESNSILISVVPHANSKPICSRCGTPGSTYDHLGQRRFKLPPVWNIALILLYTMKRVNCRKCNKVVVEQVPWSAGKSRVTKEFTAVLAFWARKLSWKETPLTFRVS